MTILNPMVHFGLAGLLEPGANLGNVIYVNLGGADANDGLAPNRPKLSIAGALADCTADLLDTIVVLDYWANDAVWPIDINVSRTHIIASPGAGAMWPTVNPTGDVASFSISAPYCKLSNFAINGGATAGCIEPLGAHWGFWVDNCWFGVTGTAQDGFRGGGVFDLPYLKITRSRFGQGLTRDGVRLAHNATRGQIGAWDGSGGNYFEEIAGVAINLPGNCTRVGIFNNLIAIPANTAGAGITLGAGTTNCSVWNNSANFGDTAMGNNPYLDGAAGGANTWSGNRQGDTLTMPA